jgi:mannose-6-phosphate isomerase-like protein (cupin superfamily)
MTTSAFGTRISKHTAPQFVWRDVCDGWTLVSNARLHIVQERMPSGTHEVRHKHETTRQFYFVLAGHATVALGDSALPVLAGEGIEIPPGVPHQIRNDSAQDVEFLVASSQPPREDRVDIT